MLKALKAIYWYFVDLFVLILALGLLLIAGILSPRSIEDILEETLARKKKSQKKAKSKK